MTAEAPTGLAWLLSLQRFGIRPGLGRTARVLAYLGHPERELTFVHVAGTNGKGSVCAYLTALLSADRTVATFVSPAPTLEDRFLVNRQPTPAVELNAYADVARAAVIAVSADDPLTEFEVLTVMALLLFRARHPDIVVWEAGLGGRYDATNVVTPRVCVITNVSEDHVDVLGPSLTDIAWNKAGIVKPGVPVVTAAADVAYLVISEEAMRVGSPVVHVGRDVAFLRETQGAEQHLHYRGLDHDWWNVPVSLFGAHQCENATVALAACECIWRQDRSTHSLDEIKAVLRHVEWPGRMEWVHVGRHDVILDGAHNPAGARSLANALAEWMEVTGCQGCTFVIGVLADKLISSILGCLLPLARRVVATEPRSPRTKKAEALANDVWLQQADMEVHVQADIGAAVELALQWEEPVCCCGSLYTVDEARQSIR